jgi:3-hydroxyacyl-[acyl-carrier-protein] dehydratase
MFRYPENPSEYIDQKMILKYLPHRYPFLMVDRILEVTSDRSLTPVETKELIGTKAVGIKNVTINEPFFQGHFPNLPVMPGVMILETMAQVASFTLYPRQMSVGKNASEGMQCVLVGVDSARFRVPVVPGDQLRIEVEVKTCRKSLWTYDCVALVGSKRVAEATILANLIPTSEKQVF